MEDLQKEIDRVGKAVYKAMQEKAGTVGEDFNLVDDKDGISIHMPNHAQFVDSGRKKGTMPPPSKLKRWSHSHGLNEYAVAYSIKKNGIKGKSFLYLFEDILNKNLDEIANAGLEDVFKEINKNLKNKNII